jgi:hypothetical protein
LGCINCTIPEDDPGIAILGAFCRVASPVAEIKIAENLEGSLTDVANVRQLTPVAYIFDPACAVVLGSYEPESR